MLAVCLVFILNVAYLGKYHIIKTKHSLHLFACARSWVDLICPHQLLLSYSAVLIVFIVMPCCVSLLCWQENVFLHMVNDRAVVSILSFSRSCYRIRVCTSFTKSSEHLPFCWISCSIADFLSYFSSLIRAAVLCQWVTIMPIVPCDVVENYTKHTTKQHCQKCCFQCDVMRYFHFNDICGTVGCGWATMPKNTQSACMFSLSTITLWWVPHLV